MAKRRNEIDSILRRARDLSPADRLKVIEGLLSPGLRLRLLAEEIRGGFRVRDEREIDRDVNRAVKRVQRAKRACAQAAQ